MMTGIVPEQNVEKQIEKQMGCMSGILQLFDRHHILTGKRLYSSTKRLPPSTAVDSSPEQEISAPVSPAIKPKKSPELEPRSPAVATELPPKSPPTLPVFQLKEGTKSSWKFYKETPRLSLDSRATTDAKGGLHPREIRKNASILSPSNVENGVADGQPNRSPSVIARLMGLEPLADSSNREPEKKAELRRSNSESRVSRDLFNSKLVIDGKNFHLKQPNQSHSNVEDNAVLETPSYGDPIKYPSLSDNKAEPPKESSRAVHLSLWKAPTHGKGFFDSTDVFPELKQTVSVEGEIEKRLRLRGIDEPSRDLETLKQILEALQLKGLLHSQKSSVENQFSHRNFVYDESPITVMKPSRSTPVHQTNRRMGNDTSPSRYRNQARRNRNLAGESLPSVNPRREPPVRSPTRTTRNSSSPTRSESNGGARRSNSTVKPRALSIETHRRVNESPETRSVSPIHSPKPTARRTAPHPMVTNRSPRNKKPVAQLLEKEKTTTFFVTEDESSSISESTISTSTETERSKMEEYKEGRSLLERCDKLLHSIAEMTTSDLQPSPVSVLDSSFYKDDSSPSPITMKRSIGFRDQQGEELEEEIWSPNVSPIQLKCNDTSEDSDFAYISDILRASHYLPEDSDVFLLLEKQQYLKGKDTSKVSRLQRKLVFDTITEILGRNRLLPPWKAISWNWKNWGTETPSLEKIWTEFQKIQQRESTDDMLDIICGFLKNDLAGDAINGWEDCPVEMSEAVLDIERLVFKDLVTETIQDLTALAGRSSLLFMSRRRLVF